MEALSLKYKEEAKELIESIEKTLLSIENNLNNPGLIEDVFRNMHTLKGNSSMFGFTVITDFTHNLESVYDLVRSGDLKMSKQILNISFAALDHLSALVNNDHNLTEREQRSHEYLSKKVLEIISRSHITADKNAAQIISSKNTSPDNNELKTWRIHFCPDKKFFLNGSNPLSILNEVQQLGKCQITPYINDIPSLENCEADVCYISWEIILTTDQHLIDISEVFKYVQHQCIIDIQEISQNAEQSNYVINQENQISYKGIISIEKNSIIPNYKKQVIPSIRVPSGRLDNLMNLVSELMTLQAKLGTLSEHNPQPELLSVSENLEKISTRLRDNAFSMCLIPIENMITPFHRLVRDLASGLNKEIEFITDGTETELDKNIMEGLSDPIMHLLRNSIDHGIEDPQTRVNIGKKRQGKILFNAYCAGTSVYIEIKDDGKGIDPEKIKKKAIAKGILGPDENLTEREILSLVFLPGFSTAEKVSEISGRGVGMDVVKRKIADIRGQIKIQSQVNVGTTITIRLPITVSIIDGLLVKINDADFVIPISAVDRCYEIPMGEQLNRFNNLIVLDGEQIPFISLRDEFDEKEKSNSAREIVIIYYEEKKVGLIVDGVVGKFQAVLKPLGKYFSHMDNISGATILGNGKIALVLDTTNVIEQFLNKKSVYS